MKNKIIMKLAALFMTGILAVEAASAGIGDNTVYAAENDAVETGSEYDGTDGEFTGASGTGWTLDADGLLTISGEPEYENVNFDEGGYTHTVYCPKWIIFREKITKVEVGAFKPKSTRYWFYDCGKIESISFDESFDTSDVTDMSDMFCCCNGITSLDISGFDTSKVTDMNNMFEGCDSLISLDVSGFDTSKVTNMLAMFDGCSNLTSLDVSCFDTSNVTNMDGMFGQCSSLISLDVSGFDTSNVTDMGGMFYWCCGLTSLDVRNFDTSKVITMSQMFHNCSSLTSLDVRSFNTSNVTVMDNMFCECSGLSSLDVSGFDTSKVTDMAYMFYGCSSIERIKSFVGFNGDMELPLGKMYDIKGIEYTTFPKGLTEPMTLYASVSTDAAEKKAEGNFKYEINSDGESITITGYINKPSGILEIPDSLGGLKVTRISKKAFCKCTDITELVLPDSLLEIETGARAWDGDEGAFRDCTNLKSITFGNSIESIGSCTWGGCSALTEAVIPSSCSYIGNCAFDWCPRFKKVVILNPSCEIIQEPGRNTFQDAKIYGYNNSTAQKYAKNHSKTFVSLTPTPTPAPSDEIVLSSEELDIFSKKTAVLQIKSLPQGITNASSIKWESDDPSIVTVQGQGDHAVLTGHDQGIAFVTATAGGKTATCTVSVLFNEYIYRADWLLDMSKPASKNWNNIVTSNDYMLSKRFVDLGGDEMRTSAQLWRSLHDTLDTVNNPTNVAEVALRESDLYEGMILEVLTGGGPNSPWSSLDIVNKSNDVAKESNKFIGFLKKSAEANQQMELLQKLNSNEGFNSWSEEDKNKYYKKLDEFCEMNHPKFSSFSKSLKSINEANKVIGTVDEATRFYLSYVEVACLSESYKEVLRYMANECPKENAALKQAISNVYQAISGSQDDFNKKIMSGTIRIAGLQVSEKLFDEFKKSLELKVNPYTKIFWVAYDTANLGTNVMFGTDATDEAYFNMVAMSELRGVAEKAYTYYSTEYQNNPGIETAERFLAMNQFMYDCIQTDWSFGKNYCKALDETGMGVINKIAGDKTISGSIKAINSRKNVIQNAYLSVMIDWVIYLEEDCPLQYSHYKDLQKIETINDIKKIVRSYQIHCPVDVYVYNSNGKLAASVVDNVPTSVDQYITVTVEGEQKTIDFYSDCNGYSLKYEGNATGKMNLFEKKYKNGKVEVFSEFYDLPLQDGKTYIGKVIADSVETMLSLDGAEINSDYNNVSEVSGKKVTLNVINGMILMDDTFATSITSQAGRRVRLVSGVENLKCWDSDLVYEEDGEWFIKLPSYDLTVTAIDENGYIADKTVDWAYAKKLKLNVKKLTFQIGDEPKEIQCKIQTSTGSAASSDTTWCISNPNVAEIEKISDSGVYIRPVGPGTAYVTAISGRLTKSVKVMVLQPSDKIEASINMISLGVNEKYRLCVTPDAATTDKFYFESSDKNICSVDQKGLIKAKKTAGSATITIFAYDKASEKKNRPVASIAVKVESKEADAVSVTDVSINYLGNKELYVGEMGYISTLINNGANNGGVAVKYTMSNKGVVKLDTYGHVTAKKAGTVTITATSGEKTDSVTLTVKQPLKLYKVNKSYVKVAAPKAGKSSKKVTFTVKTNPTARKFIDGGGKVIWTVSSKDTGISLKSDDGKGKAVFEVPSGAMDTIVTATISDPVTGKSYYTDCMIDVK